MTIDKEQLKALAIAARTAGIESLTAAKRRKGRVGTDAGIALSQACTPGVILALLDEIEHLTESRQEARDLRNKMGDRLDAAEAENETLRRDAARLTWLDESQEVDSVGPTLCCGKHRATLREAIDAAMAMEARHD